MGDSQLSLSDSGCIDTSASFYTPISSSGDLIKRQETNNSANFNFSNFSLDENSFKCRKSSDIGNKTSSDLNLHNEMSFNISSIISSMNELEFSSEDSNVESAYAPTTAFYADYKHPNSQTSFELSTDAINNLLLKQQQFFRQSQQNACTQSYPSAFSTPKHPSTNAFSQQQTRQPFLQRSNLKAIRTADSTCYSNSFLTRRFLNDVAVSNDASFNEDYNQNSSNDLVFENRHYQTQPLDVSFFETQPLSAGKFMSRSHTFNKSFYNKENSPCNKQFDCFKFRKDSQQQHQLPQQQLPQLQHPRMMQLLQQEQKSDRSIQQHRETFSKKVFVGGLPPDIDEDEIGRSFRRFGGLTVDWPHKAESKSYFPPKGYCFVIFEEEASVQRLIDAATPKDEKLFWRVSSPTVKEKPVQVRPWCLRDADFVMDDRLPINPQRTIFVGGVPRPLRAVELALIIERLYGGVSYTGIDLDSELKYPKGAARVAFHSLESYIAAVNARFVQLQFGDIDKRVEVKPYVLDDQLCKHCQTSKQPSRLAPFFCANVTCLEYFCEACWTLCHNSPDGRAFHKPLVREGTDRPRVLPFKW